MVALAAARGLKRLESSPRTGEGRRRTTDLPFPQMPTSIPKTVGAKTISAPHRTCGPTRVYRTQPAKRAAFRGGWSCGTCAACWAQQWRLAVTACGAPERSQGNASTAPEAAPKGPTVAPGDWPLINRDLTASRYSPLTDITAANVANLKTSFTYQLGGNSTAVPIVVGGVMYLPSRDRVVAVDGDTGTEIWSYALPAPATPAGGAPAGPGGGPQVSTRGVSYWPGDGTLAPRILFMSRANLVALDAATGKPASRLRHGWNCRRRNSVRRHADDLRDRRDHRRGQRRSAARPARQSARVRRPHRREALGVPDRAEGGRAVQRDVGQRLGESRRHEHVGLRDADRRAARHRLLADRGPRGELLRRRPAGQQRLRELDRGRRREDRQIRVAFPDRASRSVGHRHAVRPARCSTSCRTARAYPRSRRSASRATCTS